MEFIHAIEISNFYPCHNIGIDGALYSPAFPTGIGKTQKQITEFSIEQLANGDLETGMGMVTPRFANVCIETALLRKGQKIVNGYGQETIYSQETKDLKIKYADAELEFERVRRKYFSDKVSRLICIYLAERTKHGRELVQSMFGINVDVLEVKITHQLAISKVDVSWFDLYIDHPNEDYIIQYWSGSSKNEVPRWEYLLEGRIELEDSSLLHVLDNGTTIE